MLYHVLYPLQATIGAFNVFRYITFRTVLATLTALVVSLVLGPWLIRRLAEFRAGQPIRTDGPASHQAKAGTPTMGGVLILAALVGGTLLWSDLTNPLVWSVVAVTLTYGATGFADDYLKLRRNSSSGLRGWTKVTVQALVALGVVVFLTVSERVVPSLAFPFVKSFIPNLGLVYIPFVVLVMVGTSHAVNLTDGLDGLAIGPVLIAAATYLLFAYLAGHARLAQYLQIPYVPGSGELAIFCGAMVGASLGFLWFNTYPAQVFMGDVGSLALGGALGAVAVMTKQEVLLLVVGGVFVLEALSVIFQVGSFKLRGKRIFRMAPLHHHYELEGWAEPKIIVRFWIVSIILALVAISTLKLR